VSLPAILRVEDVMVRYGMRDQRTARRLMNEAGAFKVGGRLLVREDDLGAHERRLASPASAPKRPDASRRPRPVGRSRARPSPATGPDWWRADRD
jgi:hypothetical protein